MVLTRKQYNFNIFKNRMASIWQPGRGVNIQETIGAQEERLVLCPFFHAKDVKWVVERGPWTFDGSLIMLHKLQRGEHPTSIELKYTDFWVQVHQLNDGFFSGVVAKALANFVGEFVSYDEKDTMNSAEMVLRMRVRLDFREPLKRENKIKRANGEWAVAKFRYEKLPTFCFICDRLGHIDRHCGIYFRLPDEQIVRLWDVSLRAPPRKANNIGGERWLVEDAPEEDEGYVLKERSLNRGAMTAPWGGKFMAKLGATKYTQELSLLSGTDGNASEQAVLHVHDERKRSCFSQPLVGGSDGMEVDTGGSVGAGANGKGIQGPTNLASAGLHSGSSYPKQ
ncbi:Uncharacterized protein At4g02000 [Linum perenne]